MDELVVLSLKNHSGLIMQCAPPRLRKKSAKPRDPFAASRELLRLFRAQLPSSTSSDIR